MMSSNNNTCVICGSIVVNKKYQLCTHHNWIRLHPGETKKIYVLKRTSLPTTTKPIKQRSAKRTTTIRQDEETYEMVFERSISKRGHCNCEECGKYLELIFRDDHNKVIQRWRYSHILTKQAYPHLRHNIDNFNMLCFECHSKWEQGDRKSMQIYQTNQPIIEALHNVRR